MHDLEDYLDLLWVQVDEDCWRFVETGELHNDLQRKGIIQSILDGKQLDGFHDYNKLYIKYDVPNNRRVINKKSKKPEKEMESSCVPWKANSKKETFIKVYRKEGVALIMDKTLDVFEKGFMYTVQPFVEWKTNCIIINGQYPTVEYLAELVCVSPRKLNDIIKNLEKKNLIKRYKDGLNKKIFINPNYMCAGVIIEGEVPSYFMSEVEIEESTKQLFKK